MIHIENFKSSGFDTKDKYLYIIGHEDLSTVLAFVISSQQKYSQHPYLAREQTEIPKDTLAGLPSRCWIQCFHQVHRLSIMDLQASFENYEVTHKGKLPPEILRKVRDVVYCSDVLKKYEIEDCIDAIDNDKSAVE